MTQSPLIALLLVIVPFRSRGESPVTFSRDLAPVIFRNCTPCHRPGQSAPFSLLTFADAQSHAKTLARVTAKRTMPPWLPATGYAEFADERRLTEPEIELFQRWFLEGAPEGDQRELPPAPAFAEGWQLGSPDLVVQMPEPYTLAPDGRDLYRNFVIPAPFRENHFIRAFEFHPRNRAVHHVRIKFDSTRQSRRLDAQDAAPGFPGMKTPGKFPAGHMTTWVPGQRAAPVPEGLQWPLEKDADIVLEMHLQRTGKEEMIQPQIGFYFTNSPPSKSALLLGLSSELIDIAPGETNYLVERSVTLPVSVLALTVLPHLHYLGKEIDAFALLPDGTRRWLLHIPEWDFNWQGEYRYREPVLLPAGSTVAMRYRYDNSAANTANPNQPPRRVTYGPQSTDEMAELWIQVLPTDPGDLPALQKSFKEANDRETVAFYEQQLRVNGSNASMHTALGKVLGPMGRLDEAIQHFQAAIMINPDFVEAHYYLGLSLLTKQDTEGARREFAAVLAREPTHVKAHDGLGLIALRLNNLREAEGHFRRALELNPDDAAARSNLQKIGRLPPR